jgi:hypothetical protein
MNASNTNMNCEEFKTAIATDPSSSSEGDAGHAADCESCAAFMAEMQALDARISGALAIDVPELTIPELPAIEDDNVVNLPFKRKASLSAPAWIGIAASFALAAVIGIQMTGSGPGRDFSLADEVLAHLDHEPGALKVTDVAVSDDRLSRVVNDSVGTMDRDVGLITYAQSCVINGRTIPHLVIQGEKGPITLLLMPEEMVDGAVTLDGQSVNGVILPVGSGSIAIIGERDEMLGEIEKRVIDSVEWSI